MPEGRSKDFSLYGFRQVKAGYGAKRGTEEKLAEFLTKKR